MADSTVPEMLRCPLENIVLKSKILDMGKPHHILALAMNPPMLSDISTTILELKEVGALVRTDEDGEFDPHDGELTFVGRVMSMLPLDVRVSKLIILGYVFNVMEDAIIMAAGLSVRNIFSKPFNKRLYSYSQKLDWANGSASDLFAILHAYKTWKHRVTNRLFQSEETENVWANRYYIQVRAIRDLDYQVEDIKKRLQHCDLKSFRSNEIIHWTEREKPIILKIAICGAFYPYYFRVRQINERDAFQVINGRNPYNTVYYKGLDPNNVGLLYENQIKNFLKPICAAKDLKVDFDTNSERTFVTFINSDKYLDTGSTINNHSIQSIPGRVVTEVYKAVKLRRIEPKRKLNIMRPAEAVEYAKNRMLGDMRDGFWYPVKKRKAVFNTVIPPLFVKEMTGTVQNIIHCNKFYFQPSITLSSLELIYGQLRPEVLIPYVYPSEVNTGELVAAPYQKNDDDPNDFSYFRARILGFSRKVNTEIYFNVFYIDYGNYSEVKFTELRKLDQRISNLKEVPPCVFLCTLTGVQPSCINSPREIWTRSAIQELQNFIKQPVVAEIYSYSNNIASVYLRRGDECINDILIVKGFAQLVEENFMSKSNHDMRIRKQSAYELSQRNGQLNADDYNEYVEDDEQPEVKDPPVHLLRREKELSGPFNPLETTIQPLIKFISHDQCSIEEYSVNSLLMHSDPDCGNKLVVASSITAKRDLGKTIAWNTTVMPGIKGLDGIVSLLFAPQIELNRDRHRVRYSSILCGLGYDPKTKQSYFEEHDILVQLDAEISFEDLEDINQLRYSIETLLHTDGDEKYPLVMEDTKIKTLKMIQQVLIRVLERSRKIVEFGSAEDEYVWGKYDETNTELHLVENILGYRAIYAPHAAPTLEEPKERHLRTLKKNCEEIHELAEIDRLLSRPFECKLCNMVMENISEIRIHLLTILHRSREVDIKYVQK